MKKSNLTPLGASVLAFLLDNKGFSVSKKVKSYIGENGQTNGSLNDTIHGAVHDLRTASAALINTDPLSTAPVYNITTHNRLLALGKSSIPAMMNTSPMSSGLVDSINGVTSYITNTATSEIKVGNQTMATLCHSIMRIQSYMAMQNSMIIPLYHSQDHLKHFFSNMDDLVTSDVCGVNKATLVWGTDLVKSGKAIDLKTLATFGLPSHLLFTIREHNGLTQSLSSALILSGLTPLEINDMFDSRIVTVSQEKKLYNAFAMVQNDDLKNIMVSLNCQTGGLASLNDLLNPQKLFPNSYMSLTVPEYNRIDLPTNSKTYYLIYQSDISDKFLNRADYLIGIVPAGTAIACAAFSFSMLQIKNISDMQIEKFAKMVVNMESTNDLNLGLTDRPVNLTAIQTAHAAIGKGSEIDGSYVLSDFFGSSSGINSQYDKIQELIINLTSNRLTTLINNLLSKLITPSVDIDSEANLLIDQIEDELSAIAVGNQSKVSTLNNLWNKQLSIISSSLINRSDAFSDVNISELVGTNADIISFVYALKSYSMNTLLADTAELIESLTDGTVAGDTIIAYMRECRNTERINSAGGLQDNEIEIPDRVNDGLDAMLVGNDSITKPLEPAAIGSLYENPAKTLIPDNLGLYNTTNLSGTTLSPQDAINDVIDCNCDCWDILNN